MPRTPIASDPKVMMGKPMIAGTGIAVERILEKLGAGETVDRILAEHPQLTAEGIRAAIAFVEPALAADPSGLGVLNELIRREPIFHRPELGTTRADFENTTATDFWEVGASGRRYSRDYVLDALEKRYAGPYVDVWETTGFHCRKLAEDVYLLTYTLIQGKERKTRRSTIWQHTPEGWKIVYHQGTIVQDS